MRVHIDEARSKGQRAPVQHSRASAVDILFNGNDETITNQYIGTAGRLPRTVVDLGSCDDSGSRIDGALPRVVTAAGSRDFRLFQIACDNTEAMSIVASVLVVPVADRRDHATP